MIYSPGPGAERPERKNRMRRGGIPVIIRRHYSPLAWIVHVADEAATFMLDRGAPET